ncbi:YdiU family protein [Klenkia sp. LSe6-5]|uniref:Protein nucleotidyltransferase YdiU n=1 Tax=Klenkia sesuvii TaxID=3103137 RepID=A0ABU8DTR4_9ACTN
MSSTQTGIRLGHRFADDLPELSVPWQADPAPDRRLLALDDALAESLGLDPAWLRTPSGLAFLTGNEVSDGARPVAQGYAGHQFGSYSPRLGDGRALLLGELGDTDLHLKGSGRTPWSRGGDGLAVVGPMLREYVISTAMHALGIPTTRSLAVVGTGRTVQRETPQPGALLARTAASHLRVGSFQLARATDDLDLLQRLLDHAIARHVPEAADAEVPALALYEHVVGVQAELVAQWMLVGFVHGVMNTDNMTISGETIDYGPCAFLDAHDADTVFSSIDSGGRYRYGNQPLAAQWNLARLAEALLPLIDPDAEAAIPRAVAVLETFLPRYEAAWAAGMRAKLGLPAAADADLATALVTDLQALLDANHPDHTGFFRALGGAARGDVEPARELVLNLAAFDAWLERWRAAGPDADAMDRVNPVHVPRNHLVQEALDAATTGDLGPLDELVDVLRHPYEERPGQERYRTPGPNTAYVTYCGT